MIVRSIIPFLFLIITACSSIGYKSIHDPAMTGFKDIPPTDITITATTLAASKDVTRYEYYTIFLQGVERMNANNIEQAISSFTRCIQLVNDEGNSFFMRGRCHLNLGDLENALNDFTHAHQAGYEADKTNLFIGHILSLSGEKMLKQKAWDKALGYYKSAAMYSGKQSDHHNALHCYLKLAQSCKGKMKTATLFHAFNYIRKHRIRPTGITFSLASVLADALFDFQIPSLIKAAFPMIRYGMKGQKNAENMPFLLRDIGILYLLVGDNASARDQFGLIVRKYPTSKVYKNCFNQYHSLSPSRYSYHVKQEFSVTGVEDKIAHETIEMTLAVPQTVDDQKTSALEILLNGKKIPFKNIKDQFGTQFVAISATGKAHAGTNILEIKATVEKTGKRILLSKIKNMTVSQYKKQDKRYRLLTQTHSIVQVTNPFVQQILSELKKTIKTDNIHEVATAVYNYVIDKMSYKLYDNGNRPKTAMIDRLKRVNFSGVCEDYAALTSALLRGFGIPASCYTGPMLNEEIGHAWTVFYLPDYTPVTLDTTWGDNRLFRSYYQYYASNLTIADQTVYNSDILGSGASLNSSSGPQVSIKILKRTTEVRLIK